MGPNATARCHIALALSGGAEIEIIEPVGGADEIYRQPLTGPDFALLFHHVAYTLPSLEALTSLKAEMRASGTPIVMDGEAPEGVTYFYTDLRKPFGHYIEYVWGTPEYEAGMAAALLASVRSPGRSRVTPLNARNWCAIPFAPSASLKCVMSAISSTCGIASSLAHAAR